MGKRPDTKIVSRCQGCQWYERCQEKSTTKILNKIDGMKNTLNAIEEVGIALAKENDQLRKQIEKLEEQLSYANRCEKNKRGERDRLRDFVAQMQKLVEKNK